MALDDGQELALRTRLGAAERVLTILGMGHLPDSGSICDRALAQAFGEWRIRFGPVVPPVDQAELVELANRYDRARRPVGGELVRFEQRTA